MAMNFPNNPALNATFIVGTDTWLWNGVAWEVKPPSLESTASIFTNPTFTGVATGTFSGNLTGNTTGTHTGAVVGNVTGNTTGTHTGAVVGNVTGNVTADTVASTSVTTSTVTTTNAITVGTNVNISTVPTLTQHATNKKYVDARSVAMSIALS